MRILSSVSIRFDNFGVWVTIDPSVDFLSEVVDVSLGMIEAVM
jgi:hypothetical protein